MTRTSRCALALVLVLLLVVGAAFAGGPPQSKTDLTVSAAISLKSALDEVTQLYTAANPSVSIATNYGASGTLEVQIEQGAPVDIFLPAAPKQMDALDAKGLLLEEIGRAHV